MFTSSYEVAAVLSAVIGPVTYFSLKYLLRDVFVLGSDKVVVITGASSGVGRACAHELYRAGCQVVLCSRNVDKLRDVKNELLSMRDIAGVPAPFVLKLDVTDTRSINDATTVLNSKFPQGIHVLINNAGMGYRGEISSTVLDVDRKMMETNYFGQVALTKALLPSILKVAGSGCKTKAHILSVNSLQGLISIPSRSSYSASKFACAAFFDCLRSEVAGQGINVCSIYPGYIKTGFSVNAVSGDGAGYGKIDQTTAAGMEPQFLARKIVDAIRFCKREVVVANSVVQKIAILLRFLLPSVYFWLMKRRFSKEVKG